MQLNALVSARTCGLSVPSQCMCMLLQVSYFVYAKRACDPSKTGVPREPENAISYLIDRRATWAMTSRVLLKITVNYDLRLDGE